MAITRQSDRRKSNRRKSDRRKGDTKIINIEEEGGIEQEMTVRRETAAQKKAGSVWSWQEEFAVEWSGSFLKKKRKKHPRKGE
jgi:hypothetical protein